MELKGDVKKHLNKLVAVYKYISVYLYIIFFALSFININYFWRIETKNNIKYKKRVN